MTSLTSKQPQAFLFSAVFVSRRCCFEVATVPDNAWWQERGIYASQRDWKRKAKGISVAWCVLMFYLESMFALFAVWVCGVGYGVPGAVFPANVAWRDIRKIRLMEYEVTHTRREVRVRGRVNLKHCEGKFVTVKMNLGTNLFGFLRKVTIGFTNGIGPPLSSKHAHWSFNLLWRKAKTRNVKRIRFFAGGYSTLSARLIKAIFRPSQK